MRTLQYRTDLCVVGGGMAGLCCAIAAARHGIKTVLMHDRPVLGGNASSEIRMWIGGCRGKDNRESGIIEEIFLENFYQNLGLKYTLWDSVLYEKAMAEKNLIMLLNTSCLDCRMDGNKILSVKGWQSNAETFHVVEATYFADCSGDSILAPLTGAKYMYGREAKSDFNETIPPDVADKKTMGMSCLFQIRETDHPVPYTPPAWAYKYESDADLPYKDHRKNKNNNFWWIEIGGEWDCIHDSDRCREELLKICYGVWDHMKNYGDHGVENWELEWIGFLPGKRESRRYIGKYIVNQNDVESEGRFDDIVAYAGWTMDDHFPAGFYYKEGYPTIYHPAPTPWGLPYRCMISENIDNLCFAGRNISVTHAAMSSSRVMATCAILGGNWKYLYYTNYIGTFTGDSTVLVDGASFLGMMSGYNAVITGNVSVSLKNTTLRSEPIHMGNANKNDLTGNITLTLGENVTVSDIYMGSRTAGNITGTAKLVIDGADLTNVTVHPNAQGAGTTGKTVFAYKSGPVTTITDVYDEVQVYMDGQFYSMNAAITKRSLKPSVTGFGYKAEFTCDEAARSMIEQMSYSLWLTEDYVLTRSKAQYQDNLTLRLINFDVADFGETPVSAKVFIKLTNGVTVESTVEAYSMRQMVELINSDYTSFTATQLEAVADMIEKYATMQSWDVGNLYSEADDEEQSAS